ncbi:hypothetical protein AUP68_11129 [Ilyonectria robusta]
MTRDVHCMTLVALLGPGRLWQERHAYRSRPRDESRIRERSWSRTSVLFALSDENAAQKVHKSKDDDANPFNMPEEYRISRFFKQHSPTTRDDCDRLAADILSCPVAPTPVQGATSYTVTATESSQALKVV